MFCLVERWLESKFLADLVLLNALDVFQGLADLFPRDGLKFL